MQIELFIRSYLDGYLLQVEERCQASFEKAQRLGAAQAAAKGKSTDDELVEIIQQCQLSTTTLTEKDHLVEALDKMWAAAAKLEQDNAARAKK